MTDNREDESMALLRLKHKAQITLPAEFRKQFNLQEGDYLEVHAVDDGILLTPVSIINRQQARQTLRDVLDRVHDKLPPSDLPPEEQEEEITQIIKDLRESRHDSDSSP